MNWRGEFTCDGQLVVDCETCDGSGVCSSDHCPECGGVGDDYWDPQPAIAAIVLAAALSRAYELGNDHPRLWRPNVKGTAAP